MVMTSDVLFTAKQEADSTDNPVTVKNVTSKNMNFSPLCSLKSNFIRVRKIDKLEINDMSVV